MMYESFFNLQRSPFSMTPDPRFVYFSEHHKEALSSMLYGVKNRRGFLQITGAVGAGKTTLCRTLLSKLGENVHSALVLNPKLSEFEILQTIVEDFGILVGTKKKKAYFDALSKFLLEETGKGFNAVVIIDEAQLLSPKALEQVRILTNLETTTKKIILVGQPELRDVLNRPDLLQLRQRVAVRYHLKALSVEDVPLYIRHRLNIAGSEADIFDGEACEKLFEYSQGVPRIINVIADRALLGAFAKGVKFVDVNLVDQAYSDVEGVNV